MDDTSNAISQRSRSSLKFFALVFELSIPLWLAGAVTNIRLLPGLPVSALMSVCPAAAALILAYRENQTEGMAGLLKRAVDYRRIRPKIWYAPIILLMPAIMILSYAWMCWIGVPVPAARFSIPEALVILLAFFVSALGEELGWSGYVIDTMQERWNALEAATVLGMVWAVWHFVPLLQVQRPPAWIAWWSLGTLASRILIVWLYNNTGRSVFAAAAFHAMIDLTWQLFPINGSYFDPRVTGLITAVAAAIVIALWRPRTLARFRTASLGAS